MKLRPFDSERDFEAVRAWVPDERENDLWCARRFRYPLEKDDFTAALEGLARRTGDVPFSAVADSGRLTGFFCWSPGFGPAEGKLKFVIVDPACRGTGAASEMLRLALAYAFQETGAECVSLSVFSVNARAKMFYAKNGFTERKTEPDAFAFRDEFWNRCVMALEKDCFNGPSGRQDPAG